MDRLASMPSGRFDILIAYQKFLNIPKFSFECEYCHLRVSNPKLLQHHKNIQHEDDSQTDQHKIQALAFDEFWDRIRVNAPLNYFINNYSCQKHNAPTKSNLLCSETLDVAKVNSLQKLPASSEQQKKAVDKRVANQDCIELSSSDEGLTEVENLFPFIHKNSVEKLSQSETQKQSNSAGRVSTKISENPEYGDQVSDLIPDIEKINYSSGVKEEKNQLSDISSNLSNSDCVEEQRKSPLVFYIKDLQRSSKFLNKNGSEAETSLDYSRSKPFNSASVSNIYDQIKKGSRRENSKEKELKKKKLKSEKSSSKRHIPSKLEKRLSYSNGVFSQNESKKKHLVHKVSEKFLNVLPEDKVDVQRKRRAKEIEEIGQRDEDMQEKQQAEVKKKRKKFKNVTYTSFKDERYEFDESDDTRSYSDDPTIVSSIIPLNLKNQGNMSKNSGEEKSNDFSSYLQSKKWFKQIGPSGELILISGDDISFQPLVDALEGDTKEGSQTVVLSSKYSVVSVDDNYKNKVKEINGKKTLSSDLTESITVKNENVYDHNLQEPTKDLVTLCYFCLSETIFFEGTLDNFRGHLWKHLIEYDTEAECPLDCDEEFNSDLREMAIHFFTKHQGLPAVLCSFCESNFLFEHELYAHVCPKCK